ncbi:type III pantothenate kinase [Candidatus Omnitrophota bacterium]
MKYLLIDIGNTSVSLGVTKGKGIGLTRRSSHADLATTLRSLVKRHKPDRALVCSVVPKVSRQIRSLLAKQGITVFECGKQVKIPVRNLYKKPKEVGQDRLINVYAVDHLYKKVRLVIDVGTALTFDFISAAGAYQGGLIFPGVSISLSSLLKTCALLPDKVTLKPTYVLEGKTTAQCISSGMTLGYSFLIRGLVEYIKGKRRDFKLLLTGGDCRILVKKIAKFDYVDIDLSLKGLNILRKTLVR